MYDYTKGHNPVLEEITDILVSRIQNDDRPFFRALGAHYIHKAAANMRVNVSSRDRGMLPVCSYTVALSPSGTGKGYATTILEEDIFSGFERHFVGTTLPAAAEKNIYNLAEDRAILQQTDHDEEIELLTKQYEQGGTFVYTFDSGTVPGVKEFRNKLLLANAGAITYMVDEIGSNLLSSVELLNLYLELSEIGKVKSKLTKNTKENQRLEELEGRTPANMLLFGTPAGLLDGGPIENSFSNFLEIGYARRCFFAWGSPGVSSYESMTPEEAYYAQVSVNNSGDIDALNSRFFGLAAEAYLGWTVEVPDAIGIEITAYRQWCEYRADQLPDHLGIGKAELQHRYNKATRTAAAFAWMDGQSVVTQEYLHQAITLVEESGDAFERIMNRERPHHRLARFIASADTDVTTADIVEALPFYAAKSNRKELMTEAIAWGYKNHVIIKRAFVDGIEFFSGDQLTETDLNKLGIAQSKNITKGYEWDEVAWDDLGNIVTDGGNYFMAHGVIDGHRTKDNALPGFDLLILDVDGTTTLDLAEEVFADYKCLFYTTKSHTEESHRFRIIVPLNYVLVLDEVDYKEFMNNVMDWLPFSVDESGNQQSRAWAAFSKPAEIFETMGEQLFDALPFIPRTSRNDEHNATIREFDSLPNLERWFALQMSEGNRNNTLLRYAMVLKDSGMALREVETNVKRLNKQTNNPLKKSELEDTIFTTLAKEYIDE